MNISLEAKKVIITGATGIVGRRIALAFAREGSELLLAAREANTSLVKEVQEHGALSAHYLSVDLTDEKASTAIIEAVKSEWGAPDVLVNNAGLYPLQPLLSMSTPDWDRVMAVNLRTPFILSRDVARVMVQHGIQGSIVNISSGAALRTKVGHGHYSTSKAGIEMLTKSFALELAPFHIRVNAVAPGFSPGSSESFLPDDYVAKMAAGIPLGRLSGEFDAPAAVLFLCSAHADFITGATITVDGGRTAGTFNSSDREHLKAEFGGSGV
ncbi:MAG: SDR family NAD(P)-dependent oxidoreductase [Thermaerobacter sp.]|nr:SDR family NAD(P)-dependent oxidoreductase [Thermaerobacter sp.]